MGNHELAVSDPGIVEWFNPLARRSLEMTVRLLPNVTIRYIRRLDKYRVSGSYRFVHGFPPDSPRTYLTMVSDRQLVAAFAALEERICFLGHTHMPAVIAFDGDSVCRKRPDRGITSLDSDRKYMINVGSVGQPRDGDNHAKYIVYDSEKEHLDLRYVSYDIASVAAKITAMGLPEAHARRLW
jgi:diadenosine tetraphosphatase ApaH/serine/threonine PP2A family protein phosphatase